MGPPQLMGLLLIVGLPNIERATNNSRLTNVSVPNIVRATN